MKVSTRLVTISLALALAGSLSAAWGAESVVNLISQGEASLAAVKAAKADQDAALKKNNALVAEGNQVRATQQQLQADIAAFDQQNSSVKAEVASYEASCVKNKPKTTDQFNACKAQNAKINADIVAVNAQPPKLKQRQQDFMARAAKYNQEVQTAPTEIKAADNKYRAALATQESWLDQARDMVAAPAFQPYAKKAGCPDVMKPPKTIDAVINMSGGIIACLKKVAAMN